LFVALVKPVIKYGLKWLIILIIFLIIYLRKKTHSFTNNFYISVIIIHGYISVSICMWDIRDVIITIAAIDLGPGIYDSIL